MKYHYQRMMEQVRMGDDTKAAMLEAIMEAGPRRTIRPLRVALIAACAVVLLMGTALAAQLIWNVRLEDRQEGNPGYTLSADVTLWPLEQFSEALRRDADSADEFGRFTLTLDSWDQVEEYFNVPLAGNSLLTAPAAPYVELRTWDSGLYTCEANAGYLIRNAAVGWRVTLYTEVYGETGSDVPLFTLGSNAEDTIAYSQYQMRNGAQAQIAQLIPGEVGASVPMYYAYFARDGVLYTVTVDCRPVDDGAAQADYGQLLYEILDAFE